MKSHDPHGTDEPPIAGRPDTPWLFRPSFRTGSDVDRIHAVRQMNSAEEFMESMVVDLATIEGVPAQLEYLDGLLTSIDEMVRSGNKLGYRAILDVVHAIALEADGLTDFIGVRWFEPSPGEEAAGAIMWRISFVTDFLERELFRSKSMDASAAEMATRIYLIAAVKGICKQALEAIENFNPRGRIHMAHMARGALALTDVMDRFEGLGNEEAACEARDALVAFMLHHDVPVLNTVQWSLKTVKNYIRFDLEYMRGDEGVDEELFIANLRFFSNGNRSFAPEILRAVQLMLFEKGEKDIWQMIEYELSEEERISDLLREIRGAGQDRPAR